MVEEWEKKSEREREKYEEEVALWDGEVRRVEKEKELERVRMQGDSKSDKDRIRALEEEQGVLK